VSRSARHSARGAGSIVGRFLISAVCLVAAAAILWLAVPRAMASIILFNAESTLTSLRLGEAVPANARANLLAQQRSALAWSGGGAALIDYGYALMASQVRDAREGKKPNPGKTNAEAEKALVAGLSQMPVSADGWFLLAVIRRLTPGNEVKAASAARMSVFTGPHVPVLAIVRLRLLFRLWPQFSTDERELVYRQIRFAWAVAPDDLVELAAGVNSDWPIRIALSLQPKELQKFEAKLAEFKKEAAKAKEKSN